MSEYINRRIYTDVKSWMVYDINEAEGTAMAVEVVKRIQPKMVPGGFSAICTNNGDFDKMEPQVKEGAQPFAIERNKNGVWGFKHEKKLASIPAEGVTDIEAILAANPQAVLEEDGRNGRWITWYEFTKTGKRKTTFEKLGKLESLCHYFYDYNF